MHGSAHLRDAADIRLVVNTTPRERRFLRWDGEFRWFLFRGSPLVDDPGRVVKWCGTNSDLEERKRAEDILRNSERSFLLIVDHIDGLVAIMTAKGKL